MSKKPTYEELKQRIKELETEAFKLKQSEEALRESEENYKQLTEQLSDVVLTVKLGGRLSYLSPAIIGFGGYNPEEEVGNHIAKYFVNKKELIKALKLIKQIYIDKKPSFIEFLFKPVDREPFYVEVTGRPLIIENKVKSVHCVMRNITDRKQAEEEIKAEREKLISIFDSIDEVIYVADPETYELLYVNEAFRNNWGDGIGQRCHNVLQDRDSPCPFCTNNRIFGKNLGQPYIWEFQNTVNGRWYRCIDKAISWPDGRMVRYELAVDIHDRKQAEEERLKLEIQLQQAQKMESIGTLAGGIAHDFNNVLYSIIGYTELTMDDMPEGSLAQKNIEEVFKGAMRAKDMVQQILAFSRKADTEKKPIKVQSVVKEALKLLRTSIPSTIEIRQNIYADCGPILADPTQIHQVVMNLATNAYQAMREKGGVLELTLMGEEISANDSESYLDLNSGTYLKLTVRDTGHGMDNVVIEKIFDPYFSTKSPGEGTGMGLAVVHGIVKDHGGDIEVYSKLGEGTTFSVFLPLVETRPVAPKVISIEPVPTGTERILFVDDEETIVLMTQQTLERLGYQVTPRTSSVEALEAFRAQPDNFDLVITDFTMPNMTGIELASKLLEIRPEIPIIICTGFSEVIDKNRAKAAGIREYVMKPIVKEEIARTIRKVLDEGKEK